MYNEFLTDVFTAQSSELLPTHDKEIHGNAGRKNAAIFREQVKRLVESCVVSESQATYSNLHEDLSVVAHPKSDLVQIIVTPDMDPFSDRAQIITMRRNTAKMIAALLIALED